MLKILDDLREILEDEVGVADQKEHLDFARVLQISDKDRHWLMNENTDSLYFR